MKRSSLLAFLALVLALGFAVERAHAGPMLFWDFENATSVGSISTSVGAPVMAGVSGFASQTGGGPAEFFGPTDGIVHLTRFFGTFRPFLDFTLTSSFLLTDLTFEHHHNHNPGFPNFPSYRAQLQIDTGSGFADIGSSVLLNSASNNTTASVALNILLNPGNYKIRWDSRNLAFGTDTGTGYFALNDVTLNGAAVPEPGGLVLLTTSLLTLGAGNWYRRRRARAASAS